MRDEGEGVEGPRARCDAPTVLSRLHTPPPHNAPPPHLNKHTHTHTPFTLSLPLSPLRFLLWTLLQHMVTLRPEETLWLLRPSLVSIMEAGKQLPERDRGLELVMVENIMVGVSVRGNVWTWGRVWTGGMGRCDKAVKEAAWALSLSLSHTHTHTHAHVHACR